jgi:hypothetical protein
LKITLSGPKDAVAPTGLALENMSVTVDRNDDTDGDDITTDWIMTSLEDTKLMMRFGIRLTKMIINTIPMITRVIETAQAIARARVLTGS